MSALPKDLVGALESDCAHDLEPVLKVKKQDHFSVLLDLLNPHQSINLQYRARALYLLGRWGDPIAVNTIRTIFPHLTESEHITAIDALGRLGTKEGLEGILVHAGDPSSHVRQFVAIALGRIALPEAQHKLREISTSDPEEFVRQVASKRIKGAIEE